MVENVGILNPVWTNKLSDESLQTSKPVTDFTHEEEMGYSTVENIPFLLEEVLAWKATKS